jgi:hypothetical protein
MADDVIAHATGSQFQPHPAGQFAAQCVDVIDLGAKLDVFPGQEPTVVQKVVLLFRTGELNDEGSPIDIGREFTVSMHEKANLRAFLEDWRGKPYREAQLDEGVALAKLVGQPGYLSIVHKMSRKGRTYALIQTIMPLPKGMLAPVVTDYVRPRFYAERKAEYAAELARMRPAYCAPVEVPAPPDEDQDLPF